MKSTKSVKIVKQEAAGTFEELCEYLESQGATFLGSGAFGKAYSLNGFALKVGTVDGNEGYLSWLKHVCKMQGHPNVPVVYSAGIYNAKETSGYFMVAMEILQDSSVTRSFEDHEHRAFRDWYNDLKRDARELRDQLNKMKKEGVLKRMIRVALNKDQLVTDNPLAKAIATAAALDCDGCIDMHDGNVMMRGKTPVITDPVC